MKKPSENLTGYLGAPGSSWPLHSFRVFLVRPLFETPLEHYEVNLCQGTSYIQLIKQLARCYRFCGCVPLCSAVHKNSLHIGFTQMYVGCAQVYMQALYKYLEVLCRFRVSCLICTQKGATTQVSHRALQVLHSSYESCIAHFVFRLVCIYIYIYREREMYCKGTGSGFTCICTQTGAPTRDTPIGDTDLPDLMYA